MRGYWAVLLTPLPPPKAVAKPAAPKAASNGGDGENGSGDGGNGCAGGEPAAAATVQ